MLQKRNTSEKRNGWLNIASLEKEKHLSKHQFFGLPAAEFSGDVLFGFRNSEPSDDDDGIKKFLSIDVIGGSTES